VSERKPKPNHCKPGKCAYVHRPTGAMCVVCGRSPLEEMVERHGTTPEKTSKPC